MILGCLITFEKQVNAELHRPTNSHRQIQKPEHQHTKTKTATQTYTYIHIRTHIILHVQT